MTEVQPSTRAGTPPRSVGHLRALLPLVASVLIGLPGCDGNNGTLPDNLRNGQIGRVEVELIVPRGSGPGGFGVGSLHQILTWASSGAWSLQEFIAYRGLIGDETFSKNDGDPSLLAADYASFITQVNGVEGLKLFIDSLLVDSFPADREPHCGPTETHVSVVIQDDAKDTSWRWVSCTEGSLSNLTTTGAGPRPESARVVSAVQSVRNRTTGETFVSAYHGSVPFGTLARGEDTAAPLAAPMYVLDEQAWMAFWLSHAGGISAPEVDFATEMVIVAGVGTKDEAGDSVEVRRILQVSDGTLTYAFERVPGDFCSPAARSHVPFHVVVAPRTPAPYKFADITEERVTCGG